MSDVVIPLVTRHLNWLRYSAAALFSGLLVISPQDLLADSGPWVGKTLYGVECEGRYVAAGKDIIDYRNRAQDPGKLAMVEDTHFTERVESLTGGETRSSPMGDIDFTLRVYPNHHRALNSAMRFSLQHKRHPENEKGLPAECYLQRAIKFSPTDGVVYKLYGYYLQRKGRPQQALQAYRQALKLLPTDVMVHYNTGLILVELKRYDEALEMARPLYEAGLSLPGLKRKLVEAGVWKHSPEEIAAYRKYIQDKAAATGTDPENDELDTDNPATDATDTPEQATMDDKGARRETPAEDSVKIDSADQAAAPVNDEASAGTGNVSS